MKVVSLEMGNAGKLKVNQAVSGGRFPQRKKVILRFFELPVVGQRLSQQNLIIVDSSCIVLITKGSSERVDSNRRMFVQCGHTCPAPFARQLRLKILKRMKTSQRDAKQNGRHHSQSTKTDCIVPNQGSSRIRAYGCDQIHNL